MIYTLRAGALVEEINGLALETDWLAHGGRLFTDYDWDKHCGQIRLRLQALRSSLGNLRMTASLISQWDRCESRFENLTESDRAAGVEMLLQLRRSLIAELTETKFLLIENAHASLFDNAHPFGEEVADKVPQASVDIYEAAHCLALERFTAAVFHLMRAAEVALRGIATGLGVENAGQKDFGQLVQESRAKHDAKGSHALEKQWSADALASLELFKDAWRNPVAHGRDHYDERRATDVWNGVRAFMQSLARQPDVKG